MDALSLEQEDDLKKQRKAIEAEQLGIVMPTVEAEEVAVANDLLSQRAAI